MLYYNVYNGLSDEKFIGFLKRLIIIEKKMSDLLLPLRWKMTLSVKDNDALIIDFTIKSKDYLGNVGIEYNEDLKGETFTFYLVKHYEVKASQYSFRKDIYTGDLDYYEINIETIIEAALKDFQKWDMQFVIEKGSKISLNDTMEDL